MTSSIFAQILICIGGLLTVLFTAIEFKKKSINKILVIIGGVLTLIGGYLTYNENDKTTTDQLNLINENKRLANDNIQLSKNNENLITQNIDLTTKAQDLIKINTDLTRVVTKNTQEINNFLTSDKSYCYIEINLIDDNLGRLAFVMKGKHPISILSVRAVNLQDKESFKNFNGNILFGHEPFRSIISNLYDFPLTLFPNLAVISLKKENLIPLNRELGMSLNIFFATNKGEIMQRLDLKHKEGWKQRSIIVYDGKVVSTLKDEGFPE